MQEITECKYTSVPEGVTLSGVAKSDETVCG